MFSRFLNKKFGKKKEKDTRDGGEGNDDAPPATPQENAGEGSPETSPREQGADGETGETAVPSHSEITPQLPTHPPPPPPAAPKVPMAPGLIIPPAGIPTLGGSMGLGSPGSLPIGIGPLMAPPGFSVFGGSGGLPLTPMVGPLSTDAVSIHSMNQPPPLDGTFARSASGSTLGVPPKSVPGTRSRSESVASQGKKLVKGPRRKLVGKRPASGSVNPGDQSMMSISDNAGGEAVGGTGAADGPAISETVAASHHSGVSENAADTSGEVGGSLPNPEETAPQPRVSEAPPSPLREIPQVVSRQGSEDEEGPQFQEVTDVPPRFATRERAASHSSVESDTSPVGPVNVIPSPEITLKEVHSPVTGDHDVKNEALRSRENQVTEKECLPQKIIESTKVAVTESKKAESDEPEPPEHAATGHVLAQATRRDGPSIGEVDATKGDLGDVMSQFPLPEPDRGADRRVLRRLAADKFVTIFSPIQYFGEVKGLKRVSIFDSNIEEELSSHLVVALRPNVASHLYFDNVQLGPADVVGDVAPGEDGCIETVMEMYSIKDGGRHAFVERERDAAKLLQRVDGIAPPVSVYVTERQALMCRDGAAKRLASLVVVWRPTSSPTAEDECPVHRKLKELYDPSSRSLACALCSASEGRKMLVLSEIVSPHLQAEVMKVVEAKKVSLTGAMRKQIGTHQRIQRIRDRSVQVVNEQFDALLAVLEAKRREFIDEIDGRLKGELDDVEGGIDTMTDVTRLLDAARAGLKSTATLAPPQMATIATAIKVKVPQPSEVTPQIGKVSVNLSDLSHRIQRVPVDIDGDRPRGPAGPPCAAATPHKRKPHEDSGEAGVTRSNLKTRQPVHQNGGLQACKPGTSIFNFPLHEMHNEKGIEWRLRIEDAGDWLGIGVGVGGQLEEWAKGGIFDLHHLWVVPPSAPRIITLRVTPIANGNYKLTVHRGSGQQLDDGRIPHWHASRTAFPQVSFAGRQGRVTMLSSPAQI